jgi:hypothetical protein
MRAARNRLDAVHFTQAGAVFVEDPLHLFLGGGQLLAEPTHVGDQSLQSCLPTSSVGVAGQNPG